MPLAYSRHIEIVLLSSMTRNQAYGIHIIAYKRSIMTSIWVPILVGDHCPVCMMSWRTSLLYLMGMWKVRLHIHNSPPSSFKTSLVVVSKMSHTPSNHSAASSHLTGFIVYDICNNHIMNECIYTKIILACKS
jgi:hypothetical protein